MLTVWKCKGEQNHSKIAAHSHLFPLIIEKKNKNVSGPVQNKSLLS